MQITDVRIKVLNIDSRLKAVAAVAFDDEIVIHDIKVIEGESGLFLAMPSRKIKEDRYCYIAHPINSEAREKIEKAVFTKYQEALENLETEESQNSNEDLESDGVIENEE